MLFAVFIALQCYSSVLVTGIWSVLVSFSDLRACEALGEFRSQILSFPLQTITFSSALDHDGMRSHVWRANLSAFSFLLPSPFSS